MPSSQRRLRTADVETFVRQHCFAPAQEGLVGIELERHLVALDKNHRVDHEIVQRATATLDALPGQSRVTFEPGGQLEVSSPPRHGPSAACAVVSGDLAVVDPVIEDLGYLLESTGLDPGAGDELVVSSPRYVAMAAYLDGSGPCGRTMMCSTAALQVNLDIGEEENQARRWRLAHQLGPVLLASFANSPVGHESAERWRSGRSAAWAGIDRSRTSPALESAADPAGAWAAYALAAHVMMIQVSETRYEPILAPLPFARWLEEGHELGYPTLDDLEYHLSTLFPPVRARGWLELRMIDSLPHPWWAVAAAVSAALLDDPEAADEADRATATAAGLWDEAARYGLAHPEVAAAARRCFALAQAALPRLSADDVTLTAVSAYGDRFVDRGRCPADEVDDRRQPSSPRRTLEASWS